MQKRLIYLTLLFAPPAFGQVENPAPAPAVNQQTVNHEEELILVGRINREGLQQEAFAGWFQDEYENYTVDEASLEGLSGMLEGVTILGFIGAWCSDSQREIPHFYKILDYLGYDEKQFTLIALSNHPDFYKQSPQHEETGWNVEYVPTFIFVKDGNELGRIVESPMESLEKDMAGILR